MVDISSAPQQTDHSESAVRGKFYGGWVWAAELCGFLLEFDH